MPAQHGTMFAATILLLLGISMATPTVLQASCSSSAEPSLPGRGRRQTGRPEPPEEHRQERGGRGRDLLRHLGLRQLGRHHLQHQAVGAWNGSTPMSAGTSSSRRAIPSPRPASQNIPMPVEMEKDIEQVPGVLSADPFRKIYIDYQGRRILLLVLDIPGRMSTAPSWSPTGRARR